MPNSESLASRLRRGVEAVEAAEDKAKTLPSQDARQFVHDAVHALKRVATEVANQLAPERYTGDEL